ncbi:MAG TPA: alpha/beta hydrolase [Terracidiphilus sp.]|nr:alpha/beta hydrolase [Terracidiphilus sp.]
MRLVKKLLVIAGLLGLVAGVGFLRRPVSYFNESMYVRDCLSGVQNREVTVAGHRMHYETEGPIDGPVVVLVHGLGGHAEDWRNLAPFLAEAGFRVYLPDLIGYGRSEKPRDFSYSVRDEAEIVVGFLDAVNLKQVDLGGWSMGGAIAQHLAFRHPERVRRLMLFDSAGILVLPMWDVRLFTPTTPVELDQLDELLMPNPPPLPGFVARDILRVSDHRAWIIHRALATMLTGQDATDNMLPQLKMPVLIVWGELDKITPLSLGEAMHKLVPQSELDVIPGCGHLAPGQCAPQIAPKVVGFLKE